ncbi:MAG: hypothetical protein ACF8R7_13080 [Phycisphaerales bacterium JB039]
MARTCPECKFTYGVRRLPDGRMGCHHCGFNLGMEQSPKNTEDAMVIPWDTIEMQVIEHEEVTTDTVRVHVQATLATTSDDAAQANATLVEALTSVIDAKWRISQLLRSADDAGMERLTAIATVRVPEAAAIGLVGRLHKASRSGLNLELRSIEHRAPTEALQAAMRRLRAKVYQRAMEEVELLNTTMPDATTGPWRVGEVNFAERIEDNRRKYAHLMRHRTMPSDDDEAPPLSFGNRVVIESKVLLKRPSVAAPEGGYFGGGRHD